MGYHNAFIGKADRPTDAELDSVLGPKAKLWNQFVTWMSEKVLRMIRTMVVTNMTQPARVMNKPAKWPDVTLM